MDVCYWAEINAGAKAITGHFKDFPGLSYSAVSPLSLRENLAIELQKTVNTLRNIPRPSGIKLPLIVSSQFLGYMPIIVDIGDWIVQSWIDEDTLNDE